MAAFQLQFSHLRLNPKRATNCIEKEEFHPNLTLFNHVLLCQNVLRKQASGKTANETRETLDCTSAWKKAK